MKKVVHECDRCGKDYFNHSSLWEVSAHIPGTRMMATKWELCTQCEEKLELFIEGKLFKHAFVEFTLPCPHHVPCADPNGCQGKAYKRAW